MILSDCLTSDVFLSDVCSVAYIGPKSRTKRPKTKIPLTGLTRHNSSDYIVVSTTYLHYTPFSLRFNGHFPDGSGLSWIQVGANPIPIQTPLIWRYLGIK